MFGLGASAGRRRREARGSSKRSRRARFHQREGESDTRMPLGASTFAKGVNWRVSGDASCQLKTVWIKDGGAGRATILNNLSRVLTRKRYHRRRHWSTEAETTLFVLSVPATFINRVLSRVPSTRSILCKRVEACSLSATLVTASGRERVKIHPPTKSRKLPRRATHSLAHRFHILNHELQD